MDQMTCPLCHAEMSPRYLGDVTVHQCPSCQGIFLERAELGHLIEAENDWHRDRLSPPTQPIPRVTTDMEIPPPPPAMAQAYVEVLFG
jgi:Zn-finger nucleic acid-binding protein